MSGEIPDFESEQHQGQGPREPGAKELGEGPAVEEHVVLSRQELEALRAAQAELARRRAQNTERSRRWRAKNPERHRAQSREAQRRYQARKRGAKGS